MTMPVGVSSPEDAPTVFLSLDKPPPLGYDTLKMIRRDPLWEKSLIL